jgi:hypothetical protein
MIQNNHEELKRQRTLPSNAAVTTADVSHWVFPFSSVDRRMNKSRGDMSR